MGRRANSTRDRKRFAAAELPPTPVTVTDHALVRYLERVLDIDLEKLRREIADTCARHQGAPCVKVDGARYLLRDGVVITVIDDRSVPKFRVLANMMRVGF